MKKLCALLLFTPLLLAMTCDDDYPAIGLQGRWNLINTTNEFAGNSTDFEKGVITWDFKENINHVTIVNDTDEDDSGPKSTGYSISYSFGKEPEICEHTLRISNINYGCIEIGTDTLRISKSYADGDTFTFIR